MKETKRRALKGLTIGVLGLPVVSIADNRLYGKPGSVGVGAADVANDALRLRLASADVPVEVWKTMTSLRGMWGAVLSDPTEAALFAANPDAYLSRFGIESSVLNSSDREVQLMRAMADPTMQAIASRGDYTAFLNYLNAQNLMGGGLYSGLVTQLRSILQSDFARLQPFLTKLQDVANTNLTELPRDLAVGDDFSLKDNSVETNASVVSDVSIASEVVILVLVVVVAFIVSSAHVQKSLNLTANVNEAMFEEISHVMRAARLVGAEDFVRQAYGDVVRQEAKALLDAALSVGRTALSATQYNSVLSRVESQLEHSLGLI